MRSVVITAACRTPIGAFGGAFKNLGALDLTIPVMQELIKRSRLDAGRIDDVIWGCNYQKTYRENNLARVAAVKAGLPVTVPGITVHRNCTSSVSSVQLGFYQILAGEADFILAGGTEVMSNAPHTVEGRRIIAWALDMLVIMAPVAVFFAISTAKQNSPASSWSGLPDITDSLTADAR